jgi:CRP/FNR family cyclic AMP-dependent transcriptional regulator
MNVIAQPAPLPLTSADLWPARARRSVPGAVSRDVPAGAEVIQDELWRPVFVVESGIFLLATAGGGCGALLSALGAGEVFGHESLSAFLPGREAGGVAPCPVQPPAPRSQPQARALVPSRVLSIPAEGLRRACLRDPVLSAGLAWRLADRSEQLSRRLTVALTQPVAGRVAEALRELARVGARPSALGFSIELPVTQELLASLAGATRESVNRALRTLYAQGRVRRIGRTFVLPPGRDQWPRR